jgi:hypothetical protein
LIQLDQARGSARSQDRVMIARLSEATPEALGARWTHATDLLAREARQLGERGLTPLQRRRAVRRIQALEKVARRAMHDYRTALERELGTALSDSRRVVH